MELYKKYRPKKFGEVFGQDESVRALSNMIKNKSLPHSILFSGPSGSGKTTLARILKRYLKVGDRDFDELDTADFRGIDTIRGIRERMNMSPMSGSRRIYLLDECHKLTNDAQNGLLKILEDTPRHVYFFLATTDPSKLIKTIKTRCTEIALNYVDPKTLQKLLEDVVKREELSYHPEVIEAISEVSEGSPRAALVMLDKCCRLESVELQLEMVKNTSENSDTLKLARALFDSRMAWKNIVDILKNLDEEPEKIRQSILGYSASILLSSKNSKIAARANSVIELMQFNFFESGRAGIYSACYKLFH